MMNDELQRLIDACQAFCAATRDLCPYAVKEPDPTRPADAVVPHPLREIVKTPYAAYAEFEVAVGRAIAAAAAEPAP